MRRRGGDKLFQKKKELEQEDVKRKEAIREQVPSIIIACEDSVSAPTYFQTLVEKLISEKKITQCSLVLVEHNHTDPCGVLDDLIVYEENGTKYTDFKHRWIVIDRDSARVNGGGHSPENFNNALSKAKSSEVDVAYSNDAFELWYLLHFDYRETAISRDELLKQVIAKLKHCDQFKFAKLDCNNVKQENYTKHIFEELYILQDTAINNAKKLMAFHGENHNPESDNPSTTIHKLVEVLRGFQKK